jgi:hypothetical protein
MIYVTGDTHGEITRFGAAFLPNEKSLTEKDFVIVCGDFGFVWALEGTREYLAEKRVLDVLEKKPYTILFCDGNHENFARLNSFPTKKWNGGKVHRIRKNILHLMRGQVYEIDGKKFFTMGGAYSRDRAMRRENVSFWKAELPCTSEYNEALKNLEANDFDVDYIITHTAPSDIIISMGKSGDVHDWELTSFLGRIAYEASFKKWFFGHWHTDKEVLERFRALWFDVYEIK